MTNATETSKNESNEEPAMRRADPVAMREAREEIESIFEWIADFTETTPQSLFFTVTVDRVALQKSASSAYMKAYHASGLGGVVGFSIASGPAMEAIEDLRGAMMLARMPMTYEHVEVFKALMRAY